MTFVLPALASPALGFATGAVRWVWKNRRWIAYLLAALAFLGILWRTWAWFEDNRDAHAAKAATIAEQVQTIAARDADIATLNTELRDAEADMQEALATFTRLKTQLEADLAAVARARQSERARANHYANLAEELRRDFPETRPASPVLLHAVERVRLKLRPRQASPADRVADKDGGSLSADTAGAV